MTDPTILATAPLLPEPSRGAPRSKVWRRIKRVGWNMLPPLTFVAIVALWALAIEVFKIPPYLLPVPEVSSAA